MSWCSQLEATAPNPKPGTPDPKHAHVQWPLSLCDMLEEMEGTPGCDPTTQSPLAALACAAQPYLGFWGYKLPRATFCNHSSLQRWLFASPQSCPVTCGSLLPSSPKHMENCAPQVCHSSAQGYETGSRELTFHLPMLPAGCCGGALSPCARHKGVPTVGELIPSSSVNRGDSVTCRAGMH